MYASSILSRSFVHVPARISTLIPVAAMNQVLRPIGPNRAAAILGHSDFYSAAGGGSFQVGDHSACAHTSMEPVEARAPQELSDHILATLAEIGEEINASLNLDKVLAKTAALVKRLIDYEIFCVMLARRAVADAFLPLCHRLQPRSDRQLARFRSGRASPASPRPRANPFALPTCATIRAISTPSIRCVPNWPCRCSFKDRGHRRARHAEHRRSTTSRTSRRKFSCCSPAAWPWPSKMRACSSAPAAKPKRCCCSTKSAAKPAPSSTWKRCCAAPPNW